MVLWRENPWSLKSDHCVNSPNSVLKISNDNHDIFRLHKILIESIFWMQSVLLSLQDGP